MIALDHLVVLARSLDEGARWLEARLGVAPDRGGAHAGFGTHNALLRLGADVYLEILAPDPSQPAPARPRLFGLDEPETSVLLAAGPSLLHWVARVHDLPGALALLAAGGGVAPEDLGLATPMRRGDLAWSLAVRADGARPPAGLPSLIDWGDAPHPCTRLPDRGISLARLEVALAPAAGAAVAGLLRDPRVRLEPGDPVRLAARLVGPRGEVMLAQLAVPPLAMVRRGDERLSALDCVPERGLERALGVVSGCARASPLRPGMATRSGSRPPRSPSTPPSSRPTADVRRRAAPSLAILPFEAGDGLEVAAG